MKKKILLAVFAVAGLAASLLCFVHFGQSANKSYYSGDAISFGDRLYIATADTGSLQIFRLDGQSLDLLSKTKPYDARFDEYGSFYDAKLVSENSHLYVYAVSKYTLYKYEISDTSLIPVKQDTNTYWEWYKRVDKFGDKIVTMSDKGIKVWNSDLQVIDSYSLNNAANPYNLSSDGKYFLNIDNSGKDLQIYDPSLRQVSGTAPLNIKNAGNRRADTDSQGNIYVIDDYYAKKYDASGKLLGSFRHLDYQGYDAVVGTFGDIYFTDGTGIIKLNSDMKLEDYAFTSTLGGHNGWAMGVASVYANGEKVVVFNNSNILVLDSKLNKIASVVANEVDDSAQPLESLSLGLDKSQGAENSQIAVTGTGYQPGEKLTVSLADQKYSAQADTRGRFSTVISVPAARAGAYDIKVEGEKSGRHYSINFRIE